MSKASPRGSFPKVENKRHIIIVIIAAIIILSSIYVIRFSDYFEESIELPPGVGEIGSEHVHAKFAVLLNNTWVNFNPYSFSEYTNANDFIYMLDDESYNVIHREATGATLGLFFASLGMNYTGNCFILPEDAEGIGTGVRLMPQTEYCDKGEMKLKLYVNQELNEENENYVFQDRENILIIYDKGTSPTKVYS